MKATVKPVLSGNSKRRPKIVFQDRLLLNAGQKYCRMLPESILQYFQPSLSYHFSLRSLFCLVLSGHLRPVLPYINNVYSTYMGQHISFGTYRPILTKPVIQLTLLWAGTKKTMKLHAPRL